MKEQWCSEFQSPYKKGLVQVFSVHPVKYRSITGAFVFPKHVFGRADDSKFECWNDSNLL